MAEFRAEQVAYTSGKIAGEATFAFSVSDEPEYNVAVGTILSAGVEFGDYSSYPRWYRTVIMNILNGRENKAARGDFNIFKNLHLAKLHGFFPGDVYILDSEGRRDQMDGIFYEGFNKYCRRHIIQNRFEEMLFREGFEMECNSREEVNPTNHQIIYHFATMQNGEGGLLPLLREYTPSEERAEEITENVWKLITEKRLKYLPSEPFDLISTNVSGQRR